MLGLFRTKLCVSLSLYGTKSNMSIVVAGMNMRRWTHDKETSQCNQRTENFETTHLLCNTPRITSRPTSGNIPVNICISDSLGALTVPTPPALGRAPPVNSDIHWRMTSPLLFAFGPEITCPPGLEEVVASRPPCRDLCAERDVLGRGRLAVVTISPSIAPTPPAR